MRVAIVLFPGSNCLEETKRYFEKRGDNVFVIWHKESDINKFDFNLLVIPGGFAFGDRTYEKATNSYYYDPGEMAIKSPVTQIIKDANMRNIPILGICNGFQILLKLKLLPGTLNLNYDGLFRCQKVKCTIYSDPICTFPVTYLDVANKYGNYQFDDSKLKIENVFLYYDNNEYSTKNGSKYNVAGITNDTKTVFGMMPHPERSDSDEIYKYIKSHICDLAVTNINKLMESEHISYKSTRKYLKNMYTTSEHVVQGPGENAGILDLGDGYCLAMRVESHNHPISIDPYNGAATGVGGILRDIFTMGARPIGVCDFIRVSPNDYERLKEVVHGISDYANCFGVANVGGNWLRSDDYKNNPLVNVACFGIVKKDEIVYGNALNDDDILIYVGSKTGSDGIGGADMASKSFSKDTDFKDLKKNIQIGDPFLEKLLLEACLEISQNKLAVGMQDMGAGGVLCSSIEVVSRGREKTGKNLGCKIYLDNIPTKYSMDKYSKLASESQERMLIVARPDNKQKIFDIFEKWDLEYSVVGEVNDSGFYEAVSDDNTVFYKNRMKDFSSYTQDWSEEVSNIEPKKKRIIEDNIYRMYDATIGGRTLFYDRNNKNYSILDIHEIDKRLIISWGENFNECYKSITDMEFKPLGLVNCLNYGHPKDSIGDLKKFVEDLTIDCKKHNVPVVGGNVSLYNSTDDVSISPSPIIVMVGISQI